MTRCEYEFPSELKALHSLAVELGRYTKTSGFHYTVEQKSDYTEITHHPTAKHVPGRGIVEVPPKWHVKIRHYDGVIIIEDSEGEICKVYPHGADSHFLFADNRDPMPCETLFPRELQLPGGLELSAKDVAELVKEALARWAWVRAGLPVESTG